MRVHENEFIRNLKSPYKLNIMWEQDMQYINHICNIFTDKHKVEGVLLIQF